MKSTLYIPKRIKVGYQNRDDTYTKKLAYVIYFDDKGKLRKETSWQSWRDQSIEPEEFDNVPQSGLVINKDIKRYNWSHFSSRRTMIRVYDPRGIEIEITTENLIGILMNADVSKRNLGGSYVYAWDGKELVLLPTDCEEYQLAANYTELQGKKIGLKGMTPGCSYKTKKQEDYIYVGRYMWYSWVYRYRADEQNKRVGKKMHIFTKDGKTFEPKSTLSFLAEQNSDEIVSNYAEIVDNFKKTSQSAAVVKFEVEEIPVSLETTNRYPQHDYYERLVDGNYFKLAREILTPVTVSLHKEYENGKHVFKGYTVSDSQSFNVSTQTYLPVVKDNSWRYYHRTVIYTAEQVQAMNLGKLWVTLDNGNRINIQSLYTL